MTHLGGVVLSELVGEVRGQHGGQGLLDGWVVGGREVTGQVAA